MADQSKNLILKLKLDVDTSGTAKLTDSFNSVYTINSAIAEKSSAIAEKSKEIQNIELEKLKSVSSQKALLDALVERHSKVVNFSGLALYNLNQYIAKYNDAIALENSKIKALEKEQEFARIAAKDLDFQKSLLISLETSTQRITAAYNTQVNAIKEENRVLIEQQKIIAFIASEAEKARLANISKGYSFTGTPTATTDNRGYSFAASGTVGENRAKEAAKIDKENRERIQQELKDTIAAMKEVHAVRMASFTSDLNEQQAKMRSSIEIQTAEQVHGINSVQALRARARETDRQQERVHQAELESIRSKVSGGTISPSAGIAATAASTTKHTEAILANNVALREQEAKLAASVIHHRNLFARVGEVIGAYQIWNAVLTYTKQALLAIPNAGIELESTKAALFGIFGSEQGAKNMEFLSELANNAGQSLLGLEQAYRRYAPSAILAGASQEAINKSFKDFAEVGTILHLPEEKINSLFLALDQMFAKGVVQSEEIKKQLGNVLPGAVEVGAKAMAMSPAAFMEAMSKNLVIAKDFVPKFAAEYRKTFGGVDDSVFASIKDKLLSNLQRVQNEYLLINRDIYDSTKATMNSIVKTIAGALSTIRENLAGIGQGIQIFAGLVTLRLGIALVTAISNVTLSIQKLSTAMVILTGVSNPIGLALTALTAAIIGTYANLNKLSISYDTATGFMVNFKNEQVSLISYLKATAIVTVDNLRESFNDLFNTRTTGEEWGSWLSTKFALVLHPIDTLKQGIFQLIAAQDALFHMGSVDTPTFGEAYTAKLTELLEADEKRIRTFNSEVLAKAQKIDIDNLIASFEGKSANLVIEAIKQKKLTTNEQITRALALTEDIPAQVIKTPEETPPKGGAAAKALRNLYKDLDRDLKLITEESKTSLAELEESYTKNLVSINSYYSKKASIQNAEVERQKAVYEKELVVARKSGDAAKIEEINDKLTVLKEQANQIPSILSKEQFKDLEVYNKGLKETNADYQELIGNIQAAAKIRFDATESPKIAKYKSMAEDTGLAKIERDKAANALKEEIQLRANAGLESQINALNTERNELTTIYNQKIQVVNVQMRAGVLSQISGMFELKRLRDNEIKQLEEKVRLEETAIRVAQQSGDFKLSAKVQKEVDTAKAQLESLKAEGDIVGNFFKTSIGDSFQSAFEGLITGAMNAKQAFKSFALSVMADIAKLIASEVRSKLIGALFNSLPSFGAFRNIVLGNTFSGNGPLLSYRNANGGVYSGEGISAHSGTIVSSPTVFPFAKGVGLMGEAGPEAILPLTRGSNGKLGVQTDSAGQKAGNVYNINVTVQASKDQSGSKLGDEISVAIMRNIAREEITTAARPGNQLNRTTRFG